MGVQNCELSTTKSFEPNGNSYNSAKEHNEWE
jgi:hypothetical protein